MVSAWVEHIRDFAKRNNLTYGCALSDPNCSKEYHAKKPAKLNKKEKKEVESMGAEDINVAAPYSYKKAKELEEKKKDMRGKVQTLQSRRNKKAVENQLVETLGMAGEDTMIRNIPAPPPQKENIEMKISEVKKKGRPFKYTPEEALKMKREKTLESNRRKRAEKKAAKTTGGKLDIKQMLKNEELSKDAINSKEYKALTQLIIEANSSFENANTNAELQELLVKVRKQTKDFKRYLNGFLKKYISADDTEEKKRNIQSYTHIWEQLIANISAKIAQMSGGMLPLTHDERKIQRWEYFLPTIPKSISTKELTKLEKKALKAAKLDMIIAEDMDNNKYTTPQDHPFYKKLSNLMKKLNPTKPLVIPVKTGRPNYLNSDDDEGELYYANDKMYAVKKGGDKVMEGKGVLSAGYITENPNGLAHIYPVSHDHVLKMLAKYV